ncbi:MAG: acyl--CoA ligase [Clostridia bacterium]|nr:acyl--CoA ligase [Clostridia bacterium]
MIHSKLRGIKKLSISLDKVWMKYYAPNVRELPLPSCTILDYVKQNNKNNLNQTAIDYYGKKISYKKLFASVDKIANCLVGLGVKNGDIVSLVSVAIPETIALIYAINKIGAAANTIDPRMDPQSIRRMIIESGSKITFAVTLVHSKIKAVQKDINQDKIIYQNPFRSLPLIKKIYKNLTMKYSIEYNDKVISWNKSLTLGKGIVAPTAPYEEDKLVAITYTGGTTGTPKGVMLTNKSVNAAAFNFIHAGIVYSPGEKFLGIIPVFSSYGFVCGMHMPFCMQQKLLPIPYFVPATIGKLIKDFKPNHMISTPAFYEILINSPEVKDMDLSFLITMGSGGDTMNEGLEEKLSEFMQEHNIKYPLAQGYGMSELSAAASFCVNDRYKKGSVGIPSVTTTISIFDPEDQNKELDYNQIGEICVRGPSKMLGYFKSKVETDLILKKHQADGHTWIHSGDLGYMDTDGFLYIVGRVKRMITRFDGHKVFPINIENLVSQRKDVRNCCVVEVKDQERTQGHYPLVVVELQEDVLDKDSVCKEIYKTCLKELEERGIPVAVVWIDNIPLTGALKNDYRTLGEQFKDYDYLSWQKSV